MAYFFKKSGNKICRTNTNKIAQCCGYFCDFCCPIGNQCGYLQDASRLSLGGSLISDDMAPDVPWKNFYSGWSKLGNSFDVISSVDIEETFTGDGWSNFQRDYRLFLEPRIVKFRVGPPRITSQVELVERFGPTQVSGDIWQGATDAPTSNLFNIIKDNDGNECAQVYWDNGIYTGSLYIGPPPGGGPVEADETFTGLSYDEVLALDGFTTFNTPAGFNSFLRSCVEIQKPGDEYNPIGVDGLYWASLPIPGNGWTFQTAYRYGLNCPDYVISDRDWWISLKQGVPYNSVEPYLDGEEIYEGNYSVDYGKTQVFHADIEWERNYTPGMFDVGFSKRVIKCYINNRLIVNDPCSNCIDLHNTLDINYPNSCESSGVYFLAEKCYLPTGFVTVDIDTKPDPANQYSRLLYEDEFYNLTNQISFDTPEEVVWVTGVCEERLYAYKCDGTSGVITFDNNTRPGLTYYTMEYDEEIYFPSETASPDSPVFVQWSTGVCPVSSGDFAEAIICGISSPTIFAPSSLVYKINENIGAGTGVVKLSLSLPNPDCPLDDFYRCSFEAYYIPTTNSRSGPEYTGTSHIDGVCQPNKFLCPNCDIIDPSGQNPIVRPRGSEDPEI